MAPLTAPLSSVTSRVAHLDGRHVHIDAYAAPPFTLVGVEAHREAILIHNAFYPGMHLGGFVQPRFCDAHVVFAPEGLAQHVGGDGGGKAGVARAHDEELGATRLDDIRLGDFGSRAEPWGSIAYDSHAAVGAARRSRGIGAGFGHGLR